MKFLVALCVLAAAICSANSARVLGVFHMPAHSHFQLGDKIFKELAARGHEVTVITPYASKTPVKNFKEVVLTGAKEEMEEMKSNLFELMDLGSFGLLFQVPFFDSMGLQWTEKVFNHTNVQKLLKSDAKFDIVIMEQFVNDAFKAFCYHYSAPCVMVSTMGSSRLTDSQIGNPSPPSYVPDTLLTLPSTMNFWQRLQNTLTYTAATLFSHINTYPKHNALIQKYFPGAPHMYDLHYNTSLILTNSHVSTHAPIPAVPNMIEIGGYHINPPKKLPKDLQDYLDSAKDGVVFFSLGSNLKSKDLPKDKRDAILRALSKLKHQVLWKWEDETLPGQPPNVKLSKWLPQQDVLAHPNVKLFITHGGLLSTIETIYHGKPIVGIPVFGDQKMNVVNAEIAGYGIGVPYHTLTEEAFSKALTEALSNPRYAENAKWRSQIMHDQPIKPLDRAMFWIEYVLRHRGAPHLRTAALNLSWYQYLLLDVVAFVVVVALVSSYILCKLVRSVCCSKKSEKKVSKAKKRD